MSSVIQVFEHSTLQVGGQFTSQHFDRLVLYNERHGNRYFEVGHQRIYFRNYVGVIQVGNLTLEILPKADRAPETQEQKDKWQNALVQMLRQAGYLRLTSISSARLKLRKTSLLDIYFETFLNEVDKLTHQGLARKYRSISGNIPALKGRILFPRHLAINLVHRERFYTERVVYDRNNPFNRILRVALRVLICISANPHLVALARNLELLFQGVEAVAITDETFERLVFNRNTERYRPAIQLARLIILNFNPDVRAGREDVLAILFDMNMLFERYVFAKLKQAQACNHNRHIEFKPQVSKRFWGAETMRKRIRPDIVAQIIIGGVRQRCVLDTKWKMPADGRPSDADLHQMHTYNIQFGAQRSLLVYPRVLAHRDVEGEFTAAEQPFADAKHVCGLLFIDLFKGNSLDANMGLRIMERMLTLSQNMHPERT